GPRADLPGRLASGTAVAKELPARTLRKNLGGATALVLAVVPFDKIGIDLCDCAEARKLTRPEGPPQGTAEHPGEGQPFQPFPEPARVALAALGEGQIRAPGVLPRDRPGGLTVPRHVRDGKPRAHTAAPSAGDLRALHHIVENRSLMWGTSARI